MRTGCAPANWFQLVRFSVVGGTGYVINLAVYSDARRGCGRALPRSPRVLAFCVAVTNNFLLNRHWTFRATDGHVPLPGAALPDRQPDRARLQPARARAARRRRRASTRSPPRRSRSWPRRRSTSSATSSGASGSLTHRPGRAAPLVCSAARWSSWRLGRAGAAAARRRQRARRAARRCGPSRPLTRPASQTTPPPRPRPLGAPGDPHRGALAEAAGGAGQARPRTRREAFTKGPRPLAGQLLRGRRGGRPGDRRRARAPRRSRSGPARRCLADGPRPARRLRPQGQRAVRLDPADDRVRRAVLRLAPAVPAAAPRPARPARVLALARLLQPRRDLHLGAARLSGARSTCSCGCCCSRTCAASGSRSRRFGCSSRSPTWRWR